MTVATQPDTALAWLIPVAGPAMPAAQLRGGPRGLVVGRLEQCDIRLPVDSVSRNHARILFDGARWRIADLKSRWGTFVNGVRLDPARDVPLGEGDLLRISPWTFRFSIRADAGAGLLDGAIEAADDLPDSIRAVHTLTPDRMPSLGDEMLALLLDSATAIHAAGDEKALAQIVLEKATLGSALPNAAVLKPTGTAGRFEIVASRSPAGFAAIVYSRSLLAAAADGNVAELSADKQTFDISQSIVSMGVRSALCVPIMLGQTPAAYLYLDSRGDPNSANRLPLRPHASAFCLALGRMAGLALANLKRLEMERRAADIEAELASAAAAQQWILPKTQGTFGRFSFTGRCQPGEFLGGDFYDILPLDNDRLAVAIGDVSGHGVAASVLMTASTGYLHAVLQETGNPCAAVNRLNAFVCPRKPVGKFMTLWVGLLDLRGGTLEFVDAGHGYAMLGSGTSGLGALQIGGQFPVGLDAKFAFKSTAVPLSPAGRLLLLSDGLIEEYAAGSDWDSSNQFGVAGIERTDRSTPAEVDLVAALFTAVCQHAGRPTLSDDATAVLVKW